MADPALSEAINWLVPLVGGGGLSAVLVAYFGSKRPRPEPAPTSAMAGIGAMLADHYSIDRLTNELRRLADANERLAAGVNRYCDLMDISQALERLHGRKPDA